MSDGAILLNVGSGSTVQQGIGGADLGALNKLKYIDQTATTGGDLKGQTDAAAVPAFDGAAERADEIHQRWEARKQKEGIPCFHCPICEEKDIIDFATKDECDTHILTVHPVKVEELMLTNQPESTYTAKPAIKDPPRDITDMVGAEMADHLKNINANLAANGGSNLAESAALLKELKDVQGNGLDTATVMSKMESEAIELLPGLDPKTLLSVGRQAFMMDKMDLSKAAVKLLKKNGREHEIDW